MQDRDQVGHSNVCKDGSSGTLLYVSIYHQMGHLNVGPPLYFMLILGHNMIKFNFDTSQPGRFSVSRFCLHYSRRNHQTENESSSRVEFVSDILSPTVHLEILNNPPVITMGTVQNRRFLSVETRLSEVDLPIKII